MHSAVSLNLRVHVGVNFAARLQAHFVDKVYAAFVKLEGFARHLHLVLVNRFALLSA